MAPLRRILGIVVMIIGIAILALSFTVLGSSSVTVPEASSTSVSAITPHIYGGGTLAISWTGAADGTTVTLYSCPGDSSCSQRVPLSQLKTVASATGGSASFSASVTGGDTYLLAESGTSGNVVTTAQVTGLGVAGIIGIVIAVIGVVLVVLPSRQRTAADEEEEPATDEPMAGETLGVEMPESAPEPVVTTIPARGPPASRPMDEPPAQAPASRTPTGYVQTSAETSAGQANARGRPNITCRNCGQVNEPWITNCRRCKRSLTHTD